MPTQKQIEDAKAYLKRRLNAEQSMSRNLEVELVHFAKKLVALLKEFGVEDPLAPYALYNEELQARIKKLLQDLIDALVEDAELLSIAADNSDKDFILPLIHGEKYGMTLDGRVGEWSTKLKDELLKDFNINGVHPVTSISLNKGGGAGLERLLRHTIAIAWMQSELHNNPDAKGFYSYRGSSYPCDLCDSMVGYHPISEYPLGGWHPNCCCIFVIV